MEKPGADEIILYARQLGMDLAKDSDLLWIAEQALQVRGGRPGPRSVVPPACGA